MTCLFSEFEPHNEGFMVSVGGIGRRGLVEHDPDPDCALGCSPSRHGVGDAGVCGVHRLHQAKSAWVGGIDLERVAGVEPI